MDEKWHHILVTVAEGDVQFYLDSQLKGTKYATFFLSSDIFSSFVQDMNFQNFNVNLKKSQLIDISTWFTLTNDLRKDSVLLHFQRFIGSQPLIDTDGVLLVGAKAPSTERFIGYLQDVRIYTARLQDR